MESLWIAMGMGILILVASMASVELGISVALIEILLGVAAGNWLGLHTTPWIDFLAGFAGIVLTFLAGAEVDPDLMRERLKESLWIGGISFAAPFLGAWLAAYYVFGWSWQASQICGVALSTTSLAVVYAVLVETGLTHTTLGKIIMASTCILPSERRAMPCCRRSSWAWRPPRFSRPIAISSGASAWWPSRSSRRSSSSSRG